MADSARDELPDESNEPPADGRVKGAIETLNCAIENLNTLEDTRVAAIAAAERGAALVREELAELDRRTARLSKLVVPFLAARSAASAAINGAHAAERAWRAAVGDEDDARSALRAAQRLRKADRVQVPALKQALREANRRAKDAKAEARRVGRAGEEAAVRLGQAGEALERSGFDVRPALRQHAENCERRKGLEQVLAHSSMRLQALEEQKAAATDDVSAAMQGLEDLSNELHESQAPGQEEAAEEEAADGRGSASGDAPGASGEEGWQAEASWRASLDVVDAPEPEPERGAGDWSEEEPSDFSEEPSSEAEAG